MIRTVPNVMQAYGCSEETAGRYCDLRTEGYSREQAMLMAGLSDPPDVLDNADMAKTNKERQDAFRARKIVLEGATEVRGIFLPPDKHAELKEIAKKILAQTQKPPAK